MNTISMGAVLGLLAIGFVGGVVLSSDQPFAAEEAKFQAAAPIYTSAINIVDQEGKIRASLGLWDGNHPALVLGDDQCDRRASLAVYGKERTGLTLYGEDCKRRVALEVQYDDLPTFVLRDHRDHPRVQVLLNRDGSPLVRLFDDEGKALWEKPAVVKDTHE